MTTPIEIAITLKDDEHTYTHKELVYDEIRMSHDDPKLQALVAAAAKIFPGEPHDVLIKTKYVW